MKDTWPRVVLHVDMDAYFAAVETLEHPEYGSLPLIIGADPKGGRGRGVVSTANYAAREFGVRSAMPISRAYHLCPHGVYLRPDMEKYSRMTERIMAIFARYTPNVEPVSVDEAFLDGDGLGALFGPPSDLARSIKDTIRQETGLTASIGVAVSKSVAKIASDREKPDGLVVVPPGTEAGFLAPLPIRVLWGVGPKAAARLRRQGVRTVADLAAMPESLLTALFGKNGAHYRRMALGVDDRPVSPGDMPPERKSIGEERTFARDSDDPLFLEDQLYRLTEAVGRRLRRGAFRARTLQLKIRLEGFETYSRSRTLPGDGADSTRRLYETVIGLWREFSCQERPVRLLGVQAANLERADQVRQLTFEDWVGSGEGGGDPVDHLLDSVQERFGRRIVDRARFIARPPLPPDGKT